ncbi:MAG: DUF6308 family protein [Methylacidiphilales bacterium]|nr:DUF6308 family protein [Candidatus Methylacidiphilales bacterium]
MRQLRFEHQIRRLELLACTRQIPQNDRYLETYPELLGSIQALLPLDRSKLILVAHAVFGWMPTQIRIDMQKINTALDDINSILQGADASVDNITLLASTFQTINGNSVVAASKILHFLDPANYPIWDGKVAKVWKRPPNGTRAANNYHEFTQACRQFMKNETAQQTCQAMRGRLATAGYSYHMEDMRLIELMLFLPP